MNGRRRVDPAAYQDFSTIDWVEDSARENQIWRQEVQRLRKSGMKKWKIKLWEVLLGAEGWIVLAIVGLCIGFIAGVLNIVTEWVGDIKEGHCTVGFYLNRDFCCSGQEECEEWKEWGAWFMPLNYIVYVLFSISFAFTGAFLVYSFAPYAAGSGISEIKCIIAGFVMKGYLGAKTLAIKSIALPLTIASGLSVGKEGPSVHYAVCVGNSIASRLPSYYGRHSKLREILIACSAAGVAVAFGSPVGGVLFSLEEISTTFQITTLWRSYFCALCAIGALAAVNPFRSGQLVLFSVKYDRDWHYFEVPFYLILGTFGGLYGLFVSKWNLRAQAFRKKYLKKFAVEEATFLAAITAIICYFNQFLRIDMTESMQILFRECEAKDQDHLCDPDKRFGLLVSLFFAVIIRTLLVIVSYGCKVPAGIFVPSMAIGALFGRFVGIIVQAMEESSSSGYFATCPADPEVPCITPGTYAFLGAAAALSGIMNITITVVVIMFELTGALRYVLPTMIVVGMTKIINDRWGKGGIADQAITANGYPFLDDKEEHHYNVSVIRAMTTDPQVLRMPIGSDQITQALSTTHTIFPILDEYNYILGQINRRDLSEFDNDTRQLTGDSDLVNTSPITVSPNLPLETVVEIFHKMGPSTIFVQEQGILCGLITRKDVLRYTFQHDESQHSPDDRDQWVWDWMVKVGHIVRSKISLLRNRPS
jgi:chloride channel 3/4/5